jgi:hypothetical protein
VLKKNQEPIWTKDYTKAFHDLKLRFIQIPILVLLDWEKEFQVYVDVFNFTIGSVLSQKYDKLFDHLIYFTNRQLVAMQINYTTT